MSIGELARLTGCRYSTLKFYTEEGMLPFEQPEENLTRRFPREKAVARLQEIQRLKAQGLSIPEIKALLETKASTQRNSRAEAFFFDKMDDV